MFFDNLVIHYNAGLILQVDHYYPFGLTMAGVSDQAMMKLECRRKLNGIEFNHKEFSDGSGLDLYTAKFRGLDPQIGRLWQIDPRPSYDTSPYSTMQDDPIRYADPLADTLGIQFRKGFLGLGGKREVIYNNGNLTSSVIRCK